ncbi:MAG TPA: class I SAM-dependent methyltransferase, partial [Chloroflexota bacterium]|nr:class I SAM-dependent methyltransferase [Chloroflexota bacterium]
RNVVDLPFWLALARREAPRRVLEIGAGTGRLTIPLAREGARSGFRVTGVEAEAPMLRRAQERRAAEPDAVREALQLVAGDVRSLDLAEQFDLALLPYGVAHHLLEIEDQVAAWRAVRRHLRRDGLLCVDLNMPEPTLLACAVDGSARSVDMDVDDHQGHHLRRSVASRYSLSRQLLMHAYRYESDQPGGERHCYRSDFAMHVFFPREVQLLCLLTGYRVEQLNGSYEGEPFGDRSRLLIVQARAA